MVSNLVGHGLAVLIMGDFVHAGDAMAGNLRGSIVHTIQRLGSSVARRQADVLEHQYARDGTAVDWLARVGLAHCGLVHTGTILIVPMARQIRGG
jgi:hypothetical protein